jgi:hypothetical protein
MSRTIMRRLDRLEGSLAPVHGYIHVIYGRDEAHFGAQQAALIASGRAKADDFFFDWNFKRLPDQREFRDSETIPVTQTHDERVLEWAKKERI